MLNIDFVGSQERLSRWKEETTVVTVRSLNTNKIFSILDVNVKYRSGTGIANIEKAQTVYVGRSANN